MKNKKNAETKKINIKKVKIGILVFDVLFIPLFIIQLKYKMVNIPSYILVILANVVAFIVKEDKTI